ncbi:MAG: hypothetical protein ACYCYK_02685 [Candidatus Dormibacteria bacterium]
MRPTRAVPRHPLLLLAETPEPLAGDNRTGNGSRLGALRWPGWIGGRGVVSSPASAPYADRSQLAEFGGPGHGPLVVVVAGGRGGVGRSTLAVDLAYTLGHGPTGRRVLLVDSDAVDPDLDLHLGACRSGRELMPLSRLDQLTLRLADLHEGRITLDGCLFTDADLGFQCLLAAPDDPKPVTVGREHLDYLFEHLLAPTFDLIVVDGGPLVSPSSGSLRFWVERAGVALIPCGDGEAHRRSCARALRYFEENSSLGRGNCLAVTALDSAAAEHQRRLLAEHGLELENLPWVPKAAMVAAARQVPLAQVDNRMRSACQTLAVRVSRMSVRRQSRDC